MRIRQYIAKKDLLVTKIKRPIENLITDMTSADVLNNRAKGNYNVSDLFVLLPNYKDYKSDVVVCDKIDKRVTNP